MSVNRLLVFMYEQRPHDTFCLTPFGCGYAGYTRQEMQPLYDRILREHNARWATTVPINIQNAHINPPEELT